VILFPINNISANLATAGSKFRLAAATTSSSLDYNITNSDERRAILISRYKTFDELLAYLI